MRPQYLAKYSRANRLHAQFKTQEASAQTATHDLENNQVWATDQVAVPPLPGASALDGVDLSDAAKERAKGLYGFKHPGRIGRRLRSKRLTPQPIRKRAQSPAHQQGFLFASKSILISRRGWRACWRVRIIGPATITATITAAITAIVAVAGTCPKIV